MKNQNRISVLRLLGAAALALVLCSCDGLDVEQQAPDKCASPEGMELTTIQSTVDWINAMEKPLTLPCFLRSLPRPLNVNTSTVQISAQPGSKRSPRVFFIFNDQLVLTVTTDQNRDANKEIDLPAELEEHLLEISFMLKDENGEYLTEGDSDILTVKGELYFPVTGELRDSAPYEDILFGEDKAQTVCLFCHFNESIHDYVDGVPVFKSDIRRLTKVASLYEMRILNDECDPQAEPHRCNMLSSILDHGLLEWQFFPEKPRRN